MYPRIEYEMTQEELNDILEACKPIPVIMIGDCIGIGPQERANLAWSNLGKKMGFDSMTVMPIEGKGDRYFTAVPSETESQKKERLEREYQKKRQEEIDLLEMEIEDRRKRLNALKSESPAHPPA